MSETQSIEVPLAARRSRPASRILSLARSALIATVVLIAILAVWEGSVHLFSIPEFIFPAPSAVWRELNIIGWNILQHVWATLGTILGGYCLAVLISLPLAIAISSSPLLSNAIYPLLIIKQSIPTVAFAPILIVIMGAGEASRMTITMLIALFPMVVSTATGLITTPPELVALSRSIGGTWRKQLLEIRLPAAVPYIFSGLKVSITLSVIGAIVSEFVAAQRGLGFLIYTSTAYFKLALAFGAMGILSLIGMTLFQTVTLIERTFFSWSVGQETGPNQT